MCVCPGLSVFWCVIACGQCLGEESNLRLCVDRPLGSDIFHRQTQGSRVTV